MTPESPNAMKKPTQQDLLRKIENLEERLDATVKMQNLQFEIMGMKDFPSSLYSPEELEDAGGFVAAYFRRCGAARGLDFKHVFPWIGLGDGGNGGRIDPATDCPLCGVVAGGVTEGDKAKEGIVLSHGDKPNGAGSPCQAA